MRSGPSPDEPVQMRLSRKDTEPPRLARRMSWSRGSTGSTGERSSLGRRVLCSILILRISGHLIWVSASPALA